MIIFCEKCGCSKIANWTIEWKHAFWSIRYFAQCKVCQFLLYIACGILIFEKKKHQKNDWIFLKNVFEIFICCVILIYSIELKTQSEHSKLRSDMSSVILLVFKTNQKKDCNRCFFSFEKKCYLCKSFLNAFDKHIFYAIDIFFV